MQFEICDISEVPSDGIIRKSVENVDVLLIRHRNEIRVIAANCPHAGAPLEDGHLLEGLIVCSWHRSTFRLQDGKCIHGPSEVALSCFEAIIQNGKIYIDL